MKLSPDFGNQRVIRVRKRDDFHLIKIHLHLHDEKRLIESTPGSPVYPISHRCDMSLLFISDGTSSMNFRVIFLTISPRGRLLPTKF